MAVKLDVAFSGWASALVEVALDKVVDRLLLWLDDNDYLECWFKDSKTKVKEELVNKIRKLERMFARIRTYLDCLTATNYSETPLWLREFRHIAFNVDDFTEEFQTQMVSSKLSNDQKLKELKTFNVKITTFIKNPECLLDEYSELANTIREVRMGRKLGGFAMETHETSTFLYNSIFMGRNDVRKSFFEYICNCQDKNLSMIRILGGVGIGKTTFARQMFNDNEIKALYRPRLWVSVDKELDVKQLTTMILESVCGTSVCGRDLSLYKAQELLYEALVTTKRFFIVLDGEWHEKSSNWEKLLGPLQYGYSGSVVVVTTQSPVVSHVVSNCESIYLGDLPDGDCKSIFWKQVAQKETEMDEEVLEIGEKIIMKCAGNPLVAKAFGDFLSFKMDKNEWNYILETHISQLPSDGNEIFAALRVCYGNMPAHLKPCFTYCGIFPRGYIFEKETLVLLWMAEGLIKASGSLRMEDIGALWFDELVDRYFLEPVPAEPKKFKMNWLMREMVDLISGHDWFVGTMVNEQTKIQNQSLVRHLLVTCQELTTLDSLLGCKSLRSLILLHVGLSKIKDIPDSFLDTVKYLRVLDLTNSGIKELPTSIHMLILLRYLSLTNTSITELPIEVGLLSMLQTLRIRNCNLGNLPVELGNLGNLRHLDMCEKDKTSLPLRVGRLTMLQELREFNVLDEDGRRICELKNMVELHESLRIMKLENLLDDKEAETACLWNKEHLSQLELEWSERQNECENETAVLSKLQPHCNLKKLVINSYLVGTLPLWKWGSPSFLVDVQLQNCREIRCIGELGGLRCLKNLKIEVNHAVEVIDRMFFFGGKDYQGWFGCLESLQLLRWTNLTTWVEVDNGDFPRLKNIIISECQQLNIVPDFELFKKLVMLQFTSCAKLRFSMGIRRPPTVELIFANCAYLEKDDLLRDWPFECGSDQFTNAEEEKVQRDGGSHA